MPQAEDSQLTDPSPRTSFTRRGFLAVAAATGGAVVLASAFPSQATAGTMGGGDQGLFGSDVPFSFTLGGTPSAQLLPTWRRTTRRLEAGGNKVERTTTWTDPATGFRVRWVVTEYAGFPNVSWLVYFDNPGTDQSPVLADVLALDLTVKGAGGDEWTVHTANGSSARAADFVPHDIGLASGAFKTFSTNGGLPTNGFYDPAGANTAVVSGWPYFNVDWGTGGMVLALGWQGQWAVEMDRVDRRTLRLRGGMTHKRPAAGQRVGDTELTNLWLAPGETIRTPSIVLQPWRDGDWLDAQNSWRQWFIHRHMPTLDGVAVPPLCPTQSNDYSEYFPGIFDTADDQLTWLNAYGANDATPSGGGYIDHWWIDAGWYQLPPGATDWNHPGSWTPDADRYPNGLKPILDRAHDLGMRTIVWFEPQRVVPETWLYDNHPEWLLKSSAHFAGPDYLLDFGNPDVQAWAIEQIGGLLVSEGIDVYREDFNIDPLEYWRFTDPADRRGITQIKYVEGHLAYWEGLRSKKRGLVIDTCASGGRRLDIETMGVCINLLRSDLVLDALGNQSHILGVSRWLPLTGGGSRVTGSPDDTYNARSAMGPSFHHALDITDPNADWDHLNELAAEWHDLSDDYYGDHYPLTEPSLDQTTWVAWQFGGQDGQSGFVQAFRRPSSTEGQRTLKLRGLGSGSRYEVTDRDTGTAHVYTGRALMTTGLPVTLAKAPSAATLRYRRL